MYIKNGWRGAHELQQDGVLQEAMELHRKNIYKPLINPQLRDDYQSNEKLVRLH
jgi:hypothetical protein